MTDEELYELFMHGKTEALDELLVRHKSGLALFLCVFTGNMEDAEDLVMDAFALILSKRVGFLRKGSFKSWLYGIGRNLARNFIRKKNAIPVGFDLETFIEENESDPQESLIGSEQNRELFAAMQRLPESYMTVLYLLFFEEMSIKEICFSMKKTEKQVYNLISRAKQKLKEVLKSSREFEEFF